MFIQETCQNDGCDIKMARHLLEKHMKEDCQFKKIRCEFCYLEQSQTLMQVFLCTYIMCTSINTTVLDSTHVVQIFLLPIASTNKEDQTKVENYLSPLAMNLWNLSN